MSTVDLKGLWVPIVTPFLDNGRLDLASLRSLCHHLFEAGVTGIVALGTTGEPATLDAEEQQAVVGVCNEVCLERGRSLIVGIGTNSTAHTAAAASTLRQYSAVVAALVVVPYYTRPSVEGIFTHYKTVAAASHHPVVAYNVPYRTGVSLRAEDILGLANIPNVVGIKQAVGAIDIDTLEVLRGAPQGFQVLAGDDAFVGPTILLGGSGAIAAAAHMCTRSFVELVAAAVAGDVETTRRISGDLLPVVTAGFAEPSPAVWKAGLHAQNLITSAAVRAPVMASSREAAARLLSAVELCSVNGGSSTGR
jgi:4-hydroxy-tetrahydrodipicolinate synthase